jgi:hypothetical protein
LRISVLEQTDRLKTEFFADVSHEFRTPVALTIGALERILTSCRDEIPGAVRQQLEIVLPNQGQLLGLVNQILDLAKFEVGGMQLKASPMAVMNCFYRRACRPLRLTRQGTRPRSSARARSACGPRGNLIDRGSSGSRCCSTSFQTPSSSRARGESFRRTVSDSGIGIRPDRLPPVSTAPGRRTGASPANLPRPGSAWRWSRRSLRTMARGERA